MIGPYFLLQFLVSFLALQSYRLLYFDCLPEVS